MNRSSKSRRLGVTALAGVALLSVAACGTTVRDAHAVLSQRSNEGLDGSTGATAPSQVIPTTVPVPTTTSGLGPTTPSTSTVATTPAQTGGGTVTTSTGTTTTPTAGKPTPTPAVHVYKGPAKLSPVEV